MEVVRAEITDVDILAELNRCLIEDEQHPNPMNIAELTQRMLRSFSFKKLSGFTPSFLEPARLGNLAYRVGRVKKHEKYSRI